MKHLAVLFLCACAIVESLKVGRPNEGIRDKHAPASDRAPSPDANATKASAQDVESTNASTINKFVSTYACGGTNCLLSAKQNTSRLVWFLGDSTEGMAFMEACETADAILFEIPYYPVVGMHSHYCKLRGLTMVFTFHPGATPPPYYKWGVYNFDHTTTQDIIRSQLQQIEQIFSKTPDATIVGSFLWDIANWWEKDGAPLQHWRASHGDISQWCHATIPNFLTFVQNTVPHSRVAFRSAPPAFDTCLEGYLCRVSEAVGEMNKCLKSKGNSTNHVYAKYPLMDWNLVVQEMIKNFGGPLRRLYKADGIHPGLELNLGYMALALSWAKGS